MRDIHFPQPVSPSETIPQEGSPIPEIALIREKTALLFWESHDSLSIWLLGAESKLKITANSTYWEANLRFYGLEYGEVIETPLLTFSQMVSGSRTCRNFLLLSLGDCAGVCAAAVVLLYEWVENTG